MNVTGAVVDRPNYNKHLSTKKEILKDLGIQKYSRSINLFFKENKNVNGVIGHNLVSKVGCLITNKCVFELEPTKNNVGKTAYQKTVYLCNVEFPNSFSMDAIKADMSKFIGSATIEPTYAFSNSVVHLDDGTYFDMGLSMIDLSLKDSSTFGIVNFSKDLDPESKEIIYGNEFNPKYYCILDARANCELEKSRSGNIEDFVDSSTKIIYNTFGNEAVDNFINNEQLTGIYINKRTIAISEFMKLFFNRYLFTGIEDFEFKTETTSAIALIPKKITTFAPFSKDVNEHYLSMLVDGTINCIEVLEKELKEPFKLICGISNNFIIADVYFFNDDETVRITKPLYKMYGEFALNTEIISEEIDSHAELIKMDMLEQSYRSQTLLNNPEAIQELIGIVDSLTEALKLMIEENGEKARQLIGESAIDKHRKKLAHELGLIGKD